jgi:hypothetical protein
MNKKNALPKEFQTMLKDLKRLDDELGISINHDKKETLKDKKRKERKRLLEKIWDNWPRKTFLNKDVLQMRSNALKNPEIKTVLAKTHVGIEDCALVHFIRDKSEGHNWDCPADCSPESIQDHLVEWESGNWWFSRNDYYWGGPKDQIKILFQQSNNNRFKVIGLIEMFPEKKAA